MALSTSLSCSCGPIELNEIWLRLLSCCWVSTLIKPVCWIRDSSAWSASFPHQIFLVLINFPCLKSWCSQGRMELVTYGWFIVRTTRNLSPVRELYTKLRAQLQTCTTANMCTAANIDPSFWPWFFSPIKPMPTIEILRFMEKEKKCLCNACISKRQVNLHLLTYSVVAILLVTTTAP